MTRRHRLSKSRYQTGLNCEKALWLAVHQPHLADPITAGQQARFDVGTRVGELARERFPGGVLVEEGHTEQRAALARTQSLLEQGVPVVFEAAFFQDDVLIRADVLERQADGWHLVEVKSTTACKEEHVTDAAVQTYVVQASGLPVSRSFVAHLDTAYEYPGGEYDLQGLFVLEDVTDSVRQQIPAVPGTVARLLAMLEGPCPVERLGRRCSKPHACDFLGHCGRSLPAFPIGEIPYISEKGLGALQRDGIASILEVPLDHPALTAKQRDVCEVIQSGEISVRGDLAGTLSRLEYPLHFLDFETFRPALPLYAGTRPYQWMPFQWSDHVVGVDGRREHREFLHETPGDPRPDFLASLLEAADGSGSVIVYSSFEKTRLYGRHRSTRDFPAPEAPLFHAAWPEMEDERKKKELRGLLLKYAPWDD
jgi:hypothetical protein